MHVRDRNPSLLLFFFLHLKEGSSENVVLILSCDCFRLLEVNAHSQSCRAVRFINNGQGNASSCRLLLIVSWIWLAHKGYVWKLPLSYPFYFQMLSNCHGVSRLLHSRHRRRNRVLNCSAWKLSWVGISRLAYVNFYIIFWIFFPHRRAL